MHQNGDGLLERPEAVAFWGKNFAKVNANAMFNEVTHAPPVLPHSAQLPARPGPLCRMMIAHANATTTSSSCSCSSNDNNTHP